MPGFWDSSRDRNSDAARQQITALQAALEGPLGLRTVSMATSGAIDPSARCVRYVGTGGDTLTLPASDAQGVGMGQLIIVANTSAGAVSVVPSGTNALNRSTSAYSVSAGSQMVFVADAQGGWWAIAVPPASRVDVFTANGTWTNRGGVVSFYGVGCGGGAGGGERAAVNPGGGGGGSGGGYAELTGIDATLLPATIAITIGTPGPGGAGRGTDGNGNDGTDGGAVSAGTVFSVPGGKKGLGSVASAGGTGGASVLGSGAGGNGRVATDGDAGGAGSGRAPGGGGGGAGNSGANQKGGNGGNGSSGTGVTIAGGTGAIGAVGGNGTSVVTGVALGGGGAAGGGITSGGTAFGGGTAGNYGAGGGGGAGCTSGTSGAGSAGGPGIIVVVTAGPR